KRNPGNHIRRQLKHQSMRQKVQKDCQSTAPEEFDGPFRQMALAALLGSFLFSFELSLEPPGIAWPGVLGAAHQLLIHALQGPRYLVCNFFNLEVLDHFLDLRRDAVTACDGLAERDRLANHFEIGAARPAIMEFGGRLSSALRTE